MASATRSSILEEQQQPQHEQQLRQQPQIQQIYQVVPLQPLPTSPSPLDDDNSSEGLFKVNWLDFQDHVRRSQYDNLEHDLLSNVVIGCRDRGDNQWTYLHALRGVLISSSLDLREELLAAPADNRPIYIWNIPVKAMLLLMRFIHSGYVIGPIEELNMFMLAKHQLGIGAVYGEEYTYQVIGILNPGEENQMVKTNFHSPWMKPGCLAGVLSEDKENNEFEIECDAGCCIHGDRVPKPSFRIPDNTQMQIARSPLDDTILDLSPAFQVAIATGEIGDEFLFNWNSEVATPTPTTPKGLTASWKKCSYCARKFPNKTLLRRHRNKFHLLRD